MNNYHSGHWAEFLVRLLFRLKGYHILAANYITGRGTYAGEVDFIAKRGSVLVFVEVKKRTTLERAAYAVSETQKRRIRSGAEAFLKKHPQLAPGVILYRNRDQAFEEQLTKSTAKRLIGVSALWQASENGFTLTVRDRRDNCVKVQAQIDQLQQASRPDQNRTNIEKNLRKTGETDYEICTLEINDRGYFAPASVVNNLRREALEKLSKTRAQNFKKLLPASVTENLPYPDATDFRANVLNEQAVHFYHRHGAQIQEPALETGSIRRDVPLMVTKHCVRYALGLCLKDNIEKIKANPSLKEHFRPDPLILKSGPNTYRATFDCKKCEMTLTGRLKTATKLGELKLKKI